MQYCAVYINQGLNAHREAFSPAIIIEELLLQRFLHTLLFAYYPSTDPEAYLNSLKKISSLPVKKVFPAHHSLDIQPEILFRMRKAFEQLEADGKLHHGSGTFNYGDWGVWL